MASEFDNELTSGTTPYEHVIDRTDLSFDTFGQQTRRKADTPDALATPPATREPVYRNLSEDELSPSKLEQVRYTKAEAGKDPFVQLDEMTKPATPGKLTEPVEPTKLEEKDKNGYGRSADWFAYELDYGDKDKSSFDVVRQHLLGNEIYLSSFLNEDDEGRREHIDQIATAAATSMQPTTTATGKPGNPRKNFDEKAYTSIKLALEDFANRLDEWDKAPEDDAATKKDPKKTRNVSGGALAGGVAASALAGIGKGATDTVAFAGAMGEWAAGEGGWFTSIKNVGDAGSKAITELQQTAFSTELQAQREAISEGVKGGFVSGVSAVLDNKSAAVTMLAESLGVMVPGIGAAGAVAKLGAGAKTIGAAGIVGTSMPSGAGSGREAEQDVLKTNPETLKKMGSWVESVAPLRERLGREPTDEEVREAMARSARQMTTIIGTGAAAASTAIVGSPVQGIATRLLTGKTAGLVGGVGGQVTGGAFKQGLAAAGREGLQETIEEGAQEAAKQHYSRPEIDWQTVRGAAGVGGVLGAVAGGSFSAAGRGRIAAQDALAAKTEAAAAAPQTELEQALTPAKRLGELEQSAQPVKDVMAAKVLDEFVRRNKDDTLSAPAQELTPEQIALDRSYAEAIAPPQVDLDTEIAQKAALVQGDDAASNALEQVYANDEMMQADSRLRALENELAGQRETKTAAGELSEAVDAKAMPLDTSFHDNAPSLDDAPPTGILATPLMENLHNIGNAKMTTQVDTLLGGEYTPAGAVFFEASNHQRWAKRARSNFVDLAVDNGDISAAANTQLIYSDDTFAILRHKDKGGDYRLLFASAGDPNAKGAAKPRFDNALAVLDDRTARAADAALKVMEFNSGKLGYQPLPDGIRLGEQVKAAELRANFDTTAALDPAQHTLADKVAAATPELATELPSPEQATPRETFNAVVRAAKRNPKHTDEAVDIAIKAIEEGITQEEAAARLANRSASKVKQVNEKTGKVVEAVVPVKQIDRAVVEPEFFNSRAAQDAFLRHQVEARDAVYLAERAEGRSHAQASQEALSLTGMSVSDSATVQQRMASKLKGMHPNDARAHAKAAIDAARAFIDEQAKNGTLKMPPRKSAGPVLDQHISMTDLNRVAAEAEQRFAQFSLKVYTANEIAAHDALLRGTHADFKGLIRQGKDGPYILLTANRLAGVADAKATINHEMLGHFLLHSFLGDKGMRDLASQVYLSKDANIRATLREVKKDYPADTDMSEIAEEVLARIVAGEQATKKTMPEAARGMIVAALKKTSLYSDVLTQEDVALLGEQASLAALGGESMKTAFPLVVNDINSKGYLDSGRQKMERDPGVATLKTDWLDRATTFAFNRLNPLKRALSFAEDNGFIERDERIEAENNFRRFASDTGQKTAELRALLASKLGDNIYALKRALGMSDDKIVRQVDTILAARHVPERNHTSWLETVEIDDAATKARNKVFVDFENGDIAPEDYIPALEAIVKDENVISVEITGADGKKRNITPTRERWKFAGVTDAEAAAIEANARKTFAGHEALLEDLLGNAYATIDYAFERKANAGLLSRRVHEARGWNNYVPMRGGESEMETLFNSNVDGLNPFNILSQRLIKEAKGRSGLATHVLQEIVMQAQEATVHEAALPMLRSMADLFDKTKAFGIVVDARTQYGKEIGKWLFTDSLGNRKMLDVRDAELSKMMKSILDPENFSAFGRGALTATAFLSRTFTMRNPFYVPRAAMLDFIQAATATGLEVGPKAAMQFVANYGKWLAEGGRQSEAAQFLAAEDLERAKLRAKYAKDNIPVDSPLGRVLERHDAGGILSYQRRYGADTLASEIRSTGKLTDKARDFVFGSENPLERSAQHGKDIIERIPLVRALDRVNQHIGSFFENATRQAVYDFMRANGATKEEAALRSRTVTLDFHQRSELGRNLAPMFSFAQTALTGAERSFLMLSEKGEGFTKQVQLPNGEIVSEFDWSKVNKSAVTFMVTAGLVTTLASGAMMGEDELRKLRAEGLMDHMIVPVGTAEPGAYFKLPIERGIHQFLFGLGALAGLRVFGTHTDKDLTHAAMNGAVKSLLPVGRIEAPFDDVGKDPYHFVKSLVAGVTPTLVRPAVEVGFNVSPFGGKLDARDQISAQNKYQSDIGREGTAEAYKKLATFAREQTGGAVDMSPEAYKQLANGYIAPLGRAIDAYHRTGRVDEKLGGEYGVASKIIDSFVPKDRSAASYEVRQSIEAEGASNQALKERNHMRRLDEEAGHRKRGDRGVLGPREAQWVRDFPEAAELAKVAAANSKERTDLWNRLQDARRKGGAEEVAKVLEEQRQQAARAAKKYTEVRDATARRRRAVAGTQED